MLLYALAAIGLYTLLRQRRWISLIFIIATLAYFAVIIGNIDDVVRYRVVMLPMFAIAASCCLLRRLRASRPLTSSLTIGPAESILA